jgi:hypothetical protein
MVSGRIMTLVALQWRPFTCQELCHVMLGGRSCTIFLWRGWNFMCWMSMHRICTSFFEGPVSPQTAKNGASSGHNWATHTGPGNRVTCSDNHPKTKEEVHSAVGDSTLHNFWQTDWLSTSTCTKCTCSVLNDPRADTPFCLEYQPEGFSSRVDTRDKNGVFVLRAFKQGGGRVTSWKVVWADSTSGGYNLSSIIFL